MLQILLAEPYPSWKTHFHHILSMLTSFPRILIPYSDFFFIWYFFHSFPCEPTWWKAGIQYRLNANRLIYSGINKDVKPNITGLKDKKRNSQSCKMTSFPSTWLFSLGTFPYTPSACALSLPQEDTVHGSSKIRPNCSSWQLDFLHVHTQGANIIKTTPGIQGNWAPPHLFSWVFGKDTVVWADRASPPDFDEFRRLAQIYGGNLCQKWPFNIYSHSQQCTRAALSKRLDSWPNQSAI